MKVLLLLLIVVNIVFQSTVLHNFQILGIIPNIPLLLVVSLSIYLGKVKGSIVGFLFGIFQDISFGPIIGLNAFIFLIIGYMVGLMDEKFFKDNYIIPILLTAAATIAYESISIMFIYFLGYNIDILSINTQIVTTQMIYNSILSIPTYYYVSKVLKSKTVKNRF